MPHAIYLHSALMPGRLPTAHPSGARNAEQVIRLSNTEVLIALAFAGLVNLAMVAMAASMFHAGHPEVAEIETAYHTLLPLMGGLAAVVFMISLLASGVSSSVVGTMAGQTIMAWISSASGRRFGCGAIAERWRPLSSSWRSASTPTQALVLSQVVLSTARCRCRYDDRAADPGVPPGCDGRVFIQLRRCYPGRRARIGTVVVLGLNMVLLAQLAGL